MKKIFILTLIVGTLCNTAVAQSIQASIKAGAASNTVEIYFKPDFSNNRTYFDNLSITVAIPTQTPVPTATIATGNINGMNWSPISPLGVSGMAAITEVGTPEAGAAYAGFTFYSFTGLSQSFGTAVNLVSGTEILAATITLTGAPTGTYGQVYLASLDNINGGTGGTNPGQRYTYIQMSGCTCAGAGPYGPIGQLSPDPLAGGTLYYSNAGLSTTGQFEAGSPFVSTNSVVYLPVKLASFSGDANNCNASLKWLTIDEVNMDHFEIQQSTDGINFSKAGVVAASGMTTGSNYNFTPNQPAALTFYRLKIVDRNNEAEYSAIIKVKTNCLGTTRSVTVAPNPAIAQQGININLHGYTSTTYATLYSIDGKKISTSKLANGNGTNKLDAGKLAAGTYMVSITDSDGNTTTQKVNVNR